MTQARRIRKLRHWKQQFDPNAKFIWRKNVIWNGEQVEPGTEIPESLFANKAKLKNFWQSRTIELWGFEAPDVATGQKPELPKDNRPAPETLIGSDVLAAVSVVNDDEVELGEIVALAFEHFGEDIAAWNQLPDAEREGLLQQALDWMGDLGPEDEEGTGNGEPAKAETIDPEDLLIKHGDRKWGVKDIEKTFPTKRAALEAAEAQVEAAADDDDYLG